MRHASIPASGRLQQQALQVGRQRGGVDGRQEVRAEEDEDEAGQQDHCREEDDADGGTHQPGA